jgi:hypothetical protein
LRLRAFVVQNPKLATEKKKKAGIQAIPAILGVTGACYRTGKMLISF